MIAQAVELIAALRRMHLLGPDETPTLTELSGGVSSIIVLAHTAQGPVCVKRALPKLKVEADWFAPVARNRAEVAWMRIAGNVVPCAVPRILGEDETTMAFAMQWLDPQAYPVWKTLLRDGVTDTRTASPSAAHWRDPRRTADHTELAETFSRTMQSSSRSGSNLSQARHARTRGAPTGCANWSPSPARPGRCWCTAM